MGGWQRNDLLEQQLAQSRAQQPASAVAGWGGMPLGFLECGGSTPLLMLDVMTSDGPTSKAVSSTALQRSGDLDEDSKQVIARFEAERQALAMMDHPNIARVLYAGTVGAGKDECGRMKDEGKGSDSSFSPHPSSFSSARPYFVMELVRGLPITE